MARQGSEATNRHPEQAEPPAVPVTLYRLAELVACGQAPFPEQLRESEVSWLVTEVRRLRRTRLVRFIARQIARDLKGDAGKPTEVSDAPPTV